ncbi:hemin-degrading factor [Neptunomonas antarctica]|uniref:Putative hemin transport protein n=1 Tax=Neptunomonas antarctica TaxID=619304 RepID=A0A1N7LG75_9GAMM|nr:hemin-degrading factor [Neptunomonas antarctica]SIS72803.1 putative hemin transport protein [Neptunomonas antarctica]
MNNLDNLFQQNTPDSKLYPHYKSLLASDSKLRRRDQAIVLGVSEAAMVDQQCGVQSVRLNNQFAALIRQLPELGYIMTLTRNEHCVHERKGIYDNVRITGPMGLVMADDRKVDLRIILSRWALGFAVREETPRGGRFSLQFFDKAGIAIQKIFLQPDSNAQAYVMLVDKYRAEDQDTALLYEALTDLPVYVDDSEVDCEKLVAEWVAMTDVHQFFGILRRHNISREQAFRLVGGPWALPFDPVQLEVLLNTAAQCKLPIMCFVGNHGNIQIHTGPVENIKVMGPWLNVLDPEFNLHLQREGVSRGWLIRKLSEDGVVTSLEFYDDGGETIVQFFGVREEGKPENPEWRKLAESMLSEEQAA